MKLFIYLFAILLLPFPILCEDIWETFSIPETPGINDNSVINLVETPDGRIFIVSAGGFYQFYNNEWTNILKDTPYNDANHANIRSLTYDNNGIIWGASEMGFLKYTIATGTIEYLDKITMAGGEWDYGYLNGLTIDKNNNIWFVSRRPYLTKFDGEKFTDWDVCYQNKILAINFWSATMINDNADNIWITGDDGLMKVAANSTENSLNYVKYSLTDMKIDTGGIIDIYFDSKNRIWASGLKGEISYFDGSNWIKVPIPEEMLGVKNESGNYSITSILEDQSGEMLFFWDCAGFYLSLGDDGILKKHIFPKDFFNDDLDLGIIFDAIVAKNGSVLLGTYGNSLVRFTQHNTSKYENIRDNLKLSPNPAEDYIRINIPEINTYDFKLNNESPELIEIYNLLGEKVKVIGTENRNPIIIDVKDINQGIYYLKIGSFVEKFVKN